MAHLLEKPNTDFLIRIKQNRSSMREVARLPMFELDCDIAFTITTTQTNEDKQKRYIFLQVPKKSKPGAKTRRGCWDFQSPYQMKVRIVRFQLETGEFETIATSLPRAFALEDIRELYHLRGGIETSSPRQAGRFRGARDMGSADNVQLYKQSCLGGSCQTTNGRRSRLPRQFQDGGGPLPGVFQGKQRRQ